MGSWRGQSMLRGRRAWMRTHDLINLSASVLLMFGVSSARAEAPCGLRGGSVATVRSIDSRLEPRLADGRTIRLPDLNIPAHTHARPHFGADARAALASWLVGRAVAVEPAERSLDRWGRTAARLYAPAPGSKPGAERLWVERELVGAGWARVMPSESEDACLPQLLAAEAQARRSGLGLWADPYYAVLPATNRADFADRAETRVIVKGRITSRGAAGSRVYLNFGPDRRLDLALSVSKRDAARFSAAGRPLANFVGKTVRVRGLLDFWFGPRIDVDYPGQIEVLAGALPAFSGK